LVGGSEAPLTDFTIAQMRALKIYSRSEEAYPNRADLKQNTKYDDFRRRSRFAV
jgi:hypothetical protein